MRLPISKLLLIIIWVVIFLAIPPSTFADRKAGGIKKCSVQPSNPNPGQEVILTIETNKEVKLNVEVIIDNAGKIHRIDPPEDLQKTKGRTYSLGNFTQPGIYGLSVLDQQDTPGAVLCTLDVAFSINLNPDLKLVAPQSPITREITTILFLSITGLESSKTYNIKLPNWKGGDLTHPGGSKDWTADGSGNIIAQNICNNGQAGRTNCSETFGDQVYGLEIREKGGSVIGSLSFEVKASAASGGSGKNPCDIPDPNNPGKFLCPTAIGSIPTTIQGFAGHILTLAIGLAGGLALILMVIGSVRVLTSSGDQQKLAGGRDMIVAAVAGLLFLIFSVLILRFIGVQILGL